MTRTRKYIRTFSRILLLVGYFLLFSIQSNGRFFSAANFFDYHRASHMTAIKGTAGLTSYVPSPAKAQLRVDKRYAVKHFVKLPFTAFSPIASYEVVSRIYYVPLKVYASSDLLPTNALRGPPCA